MNWLKTFWWKSDLFISSVFGSFIATVYVFVVFTLSGKLEYSGFVDFMNQLMLSVMPMWIFLFVLVLLLYSATANIVNSWKVYLGFSEKASVGFSTFIYLFFASLSWALCYMLGVGLFNSFAVISTLFMGVVFASSMSFSLKKTKEMKGKL